MIRPVATFFAGVNGAGKTTLYAEALRKDIDFGYRLSTDELVSYIGSWKDPILQMRAARTGLQLRKKYIKRRDDFIQETTLCGHSIVKIFKELKEENYIVNLFYVGVDTVEIAKERVSIRVKKDGHGVDPELIEKRFYESRENFLKVVSYCDTIFIYDNSNKFTCVAKIKNNQVKMYNENCVWANELIDAVKENLSPEDDERLFMSPF